MCFSFNRSINLFQKMTRFLSRFTQQPPPQRDSVPELVSRYSPDFSLVLQNLKNSILGVEFAGDVVAIGRNVTTFALGDPVFGMTGATTPGAYAEFLCMPENGALLPKPDNISYEEAAAIVEGGLTALNFLHNKANIQEGQKVSIYGASGSVGTASVQVAKYFGADVSAVCSAANFEMVQSIGADRVIDYQREDFTKNGQQYDVIFDTLGKRSFAACKGSLTPDGIYLDAGNPATILPMLWTRIFGRKKAILTATYVRSASAIRQDLVLLKELIEAGYIQAVIDRYYPLAEVADAHRYVETGRKKGNVVIGIEHDDTRALAESEIVFQVS